jgi:predicted double-glycine peptidase
VGKFKQFLEKVIPIPSVEQHHGWDCGPALLRAVCKYWGVGPDEQEDYIHACQARSDYGTRPQDIARAAKHFGLRVKIWEGMTVQDLVGVLNRNVPVICAIQAWEMDGKGYSDDEDHNDNDSGHYVLAIGTEANHVLFEDPWIKDSKRGRIPFDEFEHRWHDTDEKGRELKGLGIVLWKESAPDKTDHTVRAKKIK